MPKSPAAKASLFLALALLFFVAILFFWKVLQKPYIQAAIPPVTWLVNITQSQAPISLRVAGDALVVQPRTDAARQSNDKRLYYFFWRWFQANVAITLALILATPGASWKRRLKLSGLAVLILLGIHVIDMVVEVKRICMTYYAPVTGPFPPWEKSLISVLHKFFLIFRVQATPFILWGALCFQDLFPAAKKAAVENVARNAPCPCGSGKKYKRCCGATV